MRALVVCHKMKEDLGSFKELLIERGFEIDYVLGYEDRLGDIDPCAHDLTIFMGGTMGVYQADIYPYLYHEIDYIKKRLAADLPLLGICLGAQLMAKALGKDVYKGAQEPELGWREIMVNEVGLKTSAAHLDKAQTMMFQWHGDTFDLPDEAVLLASSAQYENQIYRVGKRGLGLQCHPEVTRIVIEILLVTLASTYFGKGVSDVLALREEAEKYAENLRKQTGLFFNGWLDEVMIAGEK